MEMIPVRGARRKSAGVMSDDEWACSRSLFALEGKLRETGRAAERRKSLLAI